MAQHRMRIAKPTENDFINIKSFLSAAEQIWERKWTFCESQDKWEDWDDDDEDKIEILKIKSQIAKEERLSIDDIDNRIVMYEFLKIKYREADYSWRRVVWGGEIVIDAACDPTLDYCDFMPGIVFNHVEPEQ